MGKYIELFTESGLGSPKVHVRDGNRAVWNGSSFVAYSEGDRATYDLVLSEDGLSGYYTVEMPSDIPAGRYTVLFYDEDNVPLTSFSGTWDGTAWEAGWLTPSRTLTESVDRIKKNTALAGFTFLMISSTDHLSAKSGLTVTAERSIDGAAFDSCVNDVTEVSNGIYAINLAAADLNGDVITLKFTATGADARFVTLVTQP